VRNGQVTWVWYVHCTFRNAQRLTAPAPTPLIRTPHACARWSVIMCMLQWLIWTIVSGI
jgi:hypothetical protein